MADLAAYTGRLMWIHHDSGNGKARPHRHRVFSHIQSGYHKWRRTEEARSFRKLAIVPQPYTLDPCSEGSGEEQRRKDSVPREDIAKCLDLKFDLPQLEWTRDFQIAFELEARTMGSTMAESRLKESYLDGFRQHAYHHPIMTPSYTAPSIAPQVQESNAVDITPWQLFGVVASRTEPDVEYLDDPYANEPAGQRQARSHFQYSELKELKDETEQPNSAMRPSKQEDHSRNPTNTPITHGLQSFRRDPFDSYPTTPMAYVARTVDFFFELFSSPYVWRPEFSKSSDIDNFRWRYFRFALQHPVLFESILSLSLVCYEVFCSGGNPVPSRKGLYHRSNALVALQAKLSNQNECTDDAVILSILTLLGMDYFISDFASFEIHLCGLRRIMLIRDGTLLSSFWHAFIKSRYITYDSLWTSYTTQEERLQRLIDLKYPSHPFSPELYECVATLPAGFQQLCLSSCLSLQVIELLQGAMKWTRDMEGCLDQETGPSSSNVPELTICSKLLATSQLRPLEQCLCITIMAYHLDAFSKKPLQALTEYTIRVPQIDPPKFPHHDHFVSHCLIWIGLVLESTAESSIHSLFDHWRLQWNLLRNVVDAWPCARDWKWVHSITRQFFWSTALEERCKRSWVTACGYGPGMESRDFPRSGST